MSDAPVNSIGQIGTVGATDPSILDRAAAYICRTGTDPDDVELLLDMLGLEGVSR